MRFTIYSLSLAVASVLITNNSTATQFKHPAYYTAGKRPYQVVATQLTNSGNLDLLVADYLSNQIIILLGNGDGTFQKPLIRSIAAPIALAVGDFNEDGIPDMAVIEFGGTGHSSMAIFVGDGNGKFAHYGSYQLGVQAGYLAVADFKDNGHLDVAVTSQDLNGSVTIFLGNGKGTFTKSTTYKTPGTPGSIAAADLNGDHHPDLALVNAGSVDILINAGDGKFQKPKMYSAGGGGGTLDIAVAALRNNSDQDLVVANLADGMVTLLNKGDGTFGKPNVYLPCSNNCEAPQACTVADFNRDGNLDVACATTFGNSYFFYGDGKGKFGSAVPIRETIQNQGGYSIAAGDFDNDNGPDLAIPIHIKGKVAILLNTK